VHNPDDRQTDRRTDEGNHITSLKEEITANKRHQEIHHNPDNACVNITQMAEKVHTMQRLGASCFHNNYYCESQIE